MQGTGLKNDGYRVLSRTTIKSYSFPQRYYGKSQPIVTVFIKLSLEWPIVEGHKVSTLRGGRPTSSIRLSPTLQVLHVLIVLAGTFWALAKEGLSHIVIPELLLLLCYWGWSRSIPLYLQLPQAGHLWRATPHMLIPIKGAEL